MEIRRGLICANSSARPRPVAMDLPLIEWSAIVASLAKIAIAYALALPVAWDREREARSAGLRRFMRPFKARVKNGKADPEAR
ncbi:MAG: hypothetical protein ACXWUB_01980 [Burkholderiales bacterium]